MRRLLIVLGAIALAVWAFSSGPAAAQDQPTVAVEPSTGLSDGDTLTVTVSGFPAGSTAFSSGQCVTPIEDFLQQCDVGNIVPVALDGDGAATFEITVKTGAIGSGMCGEGADQCVIAVGSLTESESGGAPIFFGADTPGAAPAAASDGFEIWALDQTDSRADQGGFLYIWDGAATSADTAEVIDLATAAEAAGCPVGKRPHMALTNHASPPTHVIVANVGAGLIYFMDPASRDIVGCVETIAGFDGAGGSAQSHAANATPDDSMVIVADIGGRDANGDVKSGWLHKIQTDYSTNTFELVETMALDQFAEDLGTGVARPICHEFTSDGQFAYVTFGGGGILVVDVGSADGSSPMTMAQVYSTDTVPGTGCGTFVPDGTELMLTNGASTGDPNPTDGDWLYVFDTSGNGAGEFPEPTQITLPGADTHGVDVCTDAEGSQFAWSLMRQTSEITIVDLQSLEVVDTLALASDFSPDPTPDLGFMRNGRFYFTLRGPEPLTAITSLTSDARTPGVAVIEMADDCRSFTWSADGLLGVGDSGEVLPPDPHGMELVTIGAPAAAADVAAEQPDLATTGSEPATPAIIALTLIAAGFMLVAGRRRLTPH